MGDSRIPADVNDAVYQFVRRHGAEWLSKKTGTPAGTIYNKANPHDSSHHKPTAFDLLIWSQLANDYSMVQALCRALDGVFVRFDRHQGASDVELLNLVLKRDSEQAGFADALATALEDGRVSRLDFGLLHKEGYDVITAWLELLGRLESMVDER